MSHSDQHTEQIIQQRIQASIDLKQKVLNDQHIRSTLKTMTHLVIDCFRRDGKVLFCGNGGSAADAQHLSTELAGRFYLDRPALFAEALPVNVPFVTAISNDYDYSHSISRLVQSKGRKGDVLIALSTSGSSPNILKALEMAKKADMICLGFSGKGGGEIPRFCDHSIIVPDHDTPRIQEVHMLLGHILCELVEADLFGES